MKINFIDLKKQYNNYKKELDKAIADVVVSGAYINGPDVKELEKELAAFCGCEYAVTVSSGTAAIQVALLTLGLKPGDEVITSPFTFFATAEIPAVMGAVPVFVDINEATYNLNPDLVEAGITSRTKAIIPVSIFGQCPDMDRINRIAASHNIPVIEDAAQSFGAYYKDKRSCNLSELACTSFYPAKPLGTYGDGGAVFTNNSKLKDLLVSLRNHGQGAKYAHKHIGLNARLSTIQAAVLRVKLKHYEAEIKQRKTVAERYNSLLKDKEVVIPFISEGHTSVYAQYSIRVKNRDQLMQKLRDNGVPTAIHYPMPVYKQEAFSWLDIEPDNFPVTEKVCGEILSLPMSPYLTEEEQQYIVSLM